MYCGQSGYFLNKPRKNEHQKKEQNEIDLHSDALNFKIK
jgi:hypothetical protein